MEIDPYSASLRETADFLAFLFDEGLQYRTIADYSLFAKNGVIVPNLNYRP
jgi:hypothetical protein